MNRFILATGASLAALVFFGATRPGAARRMRCYTCIRVCPTRARKAGHSLTRGLLMALRRWYAYRPGNVLYP